tara:strand:+ start:536 stop:1039 length:504 start_codon:yes stop_codon:yes gene_type:complete
MKTTSILFFLFIFYSCQNIGSFSNSYSPSLKNKIEIIYSYQDASVPPEDHRSYSIILSNNNYRFVVDSYGEIIKDTTFVLPNQTKKIKQTLRAFKKGQIKNVKRDKTNNGCSGGNGEEITIKKKGELYFKGSNYYCAGQTEGDLSGDIKLFLKELKKEINPNTFKYN